MTPAGMFAMAFGNALRAKWPAVRIFGSAHLYWPEYLRGLTVPSGAEWRR